ncbi:MAG TPA: hypothetical protein VF731_01360 [Solirubrobacterales bacterium]
MSGLPPVAPGAVPADVRSAGPQAARSYESDLGFEKLLLSQLLTEALPEESEGGEGEASEPKPVGLPETLAGAISATGGTGIAADLYRTTQA